MRATPETSFAVEVSEPLRDRVGGRATIEIILKGIPKAGLVPHELSKQYPMFTGCDLQYLPGVESVESTLLPGQRFRVVPRAISPLFGPTHQSIWSTPLVVLGAFFLVSPAASIIAGLVTLCLTLYGVVHDLEFTRLRRLLDSGLSHSA